MSACHIHDPVWPWRWKRNFCPKEISLVGGSHISLQISFIVITRKHFSTVCNWGEIKWSLFKKKKNQPIYFPVHCFKLFVFSSCNLIVFCFFIFNPIWSNIGTFNFYFVILKGKSKSLGFNSAKPSWLEISVFKHTQAIWRTFPPHRPRLRPCVELFYYKSHFHVIGISLANYVDAVFMFFHAFYWFSSWVYRCYSSYNMNYMST